MRPFVLAQINLIVQDMDASVSFYRRLGWTMETPTPEHARTATRDEVDALYADLVKHGGAGRQPPYDAFWGSRFAIVDDPDGHPVGLLSPVDPARRFWPPSTPPTASG